MVEKRGFQAMFLFTAKTIKKVFINFNGDDIKSSAYVFNDLNQNS